MNIIAVDDERYALKAIARVIQSELPDTQPVLFSRAEDALEYASKTRVDIAFLDIEMDGMNGLILAEQMKEIHSKTNIVFVTGYSEYAMDAINQYPSGYLLKPITKDSLCSALENLRHPIEPFEEKRMRVRTFGNFDVFIDGKPLHFPRSKSKELLAYIVHKNGASCAMRELAARLFEDNSETNVRPYVSTLIKTLEEAGAGDVIIKRFNSIAVDTSKFDCDLYRFLNGDPQAINEYTGEYMSQYSWGEFMMGYLDENLKRR